MNRQLKRILTYFKMTALFTVLGFIVLYLGGSPLAAYVISQGNMIIVKGAPQNPNESVPDVSDLATVFNNASDMSEIQAPGLDTQYGTIACERIDLTAPLYYGDSDIDLLSGAGQYPLSALPGEDKPILVSGHDGTFFAPLADIKIGDTVRIVTNYGEFNYKVTNKIIAEAKDATAYDLTQEKEQLILYTCYPFGQLVGERSKRFFVYCDRIYSNTDSGR